MNAKDKQDLELVHYRLDELDKKMDELKADMSKAHGKKQNTQYRESTTKWRSVVGVGVIGLVLDKVWSLFQ